MCTANTTLDRQAAINHTTTLSKSQLQCQPYHAGVTPLFSLSTGSHRNICIPCLSLPAVRRVVPTVYTTAPCLCRRAAVRLPVTTGVRVAAHPLQAAALRESGRGGVGSRHGAPCDERRCCRRPRRHGRAGADGQGEGEGEDVATGLTHMRVAALQRRHGHAHDGLRRPGRGQRILQVSACCLL